MPTIIDELIVALSLDPAKFKRGADDVVKGSDNVKRAAKGMEEALTGVEKELLRLGQLFVGFAGVAGFVTWITNITKATAELGYLSRQLNTTARDMWAWGRVGQAVGLSAESVTQGYLKLSNSIADFLTGQGQATGAQRYLAQRGVQFFDPKTRRPAGLNTLMPQAAQAVQGLQPEMASSILRGAGFNDALAGIILRHQGDQRGMMRELEKYQRMGPTDQEIKHTQESMRLFQEQMARMDKAGREIANITLPTFNKVLERLGIMLKEDAKNFEVFLKFLDNLRVSFVNFDRWFAGSWIGRAAGKILGVPTSGPYSRSEQGFGSGTGRQKLGGRVGINVDDNNSGQYQGAPIPASTAGGAFLANKRAGFAEQLKDPATRELLGGVISSENPGAGPAVAESLMNRTELVNEDRAKRGLPPLTLKDMMVGHPSIGGGKSFYGPMRTGAINQHLAQMKSDPAYRARMNKYIDQSLGGSNVTQGYTDQGSRGDPNYHTGGVGVNINGERFNNWGYRGSSEWTKARQEQYAAQGKDPSIWDRVGRMFGGGGSATAGERNANSGNWGNTNRNIPWLDHGLSIIKGVPSNTYNNSSSAETHIGQFTVNTTDRANPWGMAAQIKDAVQRSNIMSNSNSGPN